MNHSLTKTLLLLAISLFVLAHIAVGQTLLPAGSLDTSFGREGRLSARYGFESKLSSVALQADGKIIVAGATSYLNYRGNFALARYNSNGTLDESFAGGGLLITRFEGSSHASSTIAIQPDGKIVVTGQLTPAYQPGFPLQYDFVVLRFNSDGLPDTSFGRNGEVITDFGGRKEHSKALLLQADGKIIVGGSTTEYAVKPPYPDLLLARYNPDGSLDQSFNSTGMVITPYRTPYESFTTMALQGDGKILMASNVYSDKDGDILITRYNADGSIDQDFGVEGRVTMDFGGYDYVQSLLIQADGKIVTAGYQREYVLGHTGSSILLARFNPDGSLDQNFGGRGKVIGSFDNFAEAYSAALQSDGKVLVAGATGPGNPNSSYSLLDFIAVRYNADGTLDNEFGNGGKAIADFGRLERAKAMAVDAKGNIVLAGYTGDYTWDGFDQSDFALARLIGVSPPDFALSTSAATVSATRGSKIRVPIQIDRLHGFAGSVTLSAADTGSPKILITEPLQTTSGTGVSFTIKIKKGAPGGNHQLVFKGKDEAGHERSVSITLVIQ
jgi:uncharacterized delta-60 repeat protein